jgi:hypothetical protein
MNQLQPCDVDLITPLPFACRMPSDQRIDAEWFNSLSQPAWWHRHSLAAPGDGFRPSPPDRNDRVTLLPRSSSGKVDVLVPDLANLLTDEFANLDAWLNTTIAEAQVAGFVEIVWDGPLMA